MIKTYKFRLYPTEEQEQIMHNTCFLCSILYNRGLAERKEKWENEKLSLEIQNRLNGRWFDCRDRAVPWIDGRLVRLEIATEITERKEAERKLKENEEKYRTLFEQNLIAIYLHDFEGNMFDVNKQACLLSRTVRRRTWKQY